jgi:hypothetical protein
MPGASGRMGRVIAAIAAAAARFADGGYVAEQPRDRLPVGGRLSEATPLFEQTLADRVRVLGPDHPDTLAWRNYLAGAYEPARLAEAIPHD